MYMYYTLCRFVNPSLARNIGIKSGEEDFDDYVIQSFSFRNGNICNNPYMNCKLYQF